MTKYSVIPKSLTWLPLVTILCFEGFWTCSLTPSKLNSQDFLIKVQFKAFYQIVHSQEAHGHITEPLGA